jgi:hypothetical protein
VALALLLALPGCGDAAPVPDCWDEDLPRVQAHPESALVRARVTLNQLTSYTTGATGTDSSTITGTFTDTSAVITTFRKKSDIFAVDNCYLLTGQPVQNCRPPHTDPCTLEYLDVAGVELAGLQGGSRSLTSTSRGIYSSAAPPVPMYGAGPVKLAVSGKTGSGGFPSSYVQELEPPAPLVVEYPPPGQAVGTGPADLKIRWEPGNGDLILLNLTKVGGSKDTVQCTLVDDGCQTLLSTALDWLKINQGDLYRLSLSRIRTRVKALDDKTSAQLTLVAETKFELRR